MAYDQNDVRTVGPAHFVRLRRWSQRKPAVALMGEFSAGKSTLLNFLIEEDLLPTRATATELPPVWFTHGRKTSYYVTADGTRVPLPDNDLDKVDRKARYIRLYVEAEILEHCDVIDTPGISDPNLAVETWRTAAGFANMVLWCTSATQAWRQTEFSAWTSLPERLRKHSLLVVTRADKLTTEVDRDKVARRMARETSELFAATIFMSTPNAVLAKAELANGVDTPMWEESGAGPLLDNLVARLEGIYADKSALFGRYALAEGEMLDEPSESEAAEAEAEAAPADEPVAVEEPVAAPAMPRRVTASRPEPARPARSAEPSPVAEEAPEPFAESLPESVVEAAPEAVAEPEPVVAREMVRPEAPDPGPYLARAHEARQAEFLRAEEERLAAEKAAEEEQRAEAAEVADEPASESAATVPPQVRLWREIAARHSGSPSNEEMVAMIDELLLGLYGKAETQPDGAARAETGAGKSGDTASAGWRRLA